MLRSPPPTEKEVISLSASSREMTLGEMLRSPAPRHQQPQQEQEEDAAAITSCPSFRKLSLEEKEAVEEGEGEGEPSATDFPSEEADGDDEFEFTFVTIDPDVTAADEIFFNGQIRPVYPVFGRDIKLLFSRDRGGEEGRKEKGAVVRVPLRQLMIEEERDAAASCSSSEADELEGIPADSYCVWNPRSPSPSPSPDRRKKSKSTGSLSRRWRLKDLVVGRSSSDGKKKFVFLAPHIPPPPPAAAAAAAAPLAQPPREGERGAGRRGDGGGRRREADVVRARQVYYYGSGQGGSASAGEQGQRRSFLPYRRDLVGLFASVNGTTRGFHPF